MSNLLDGLAPWPVNDFAVYGEVEVRKLNRIQKLVGSFLGRNWVAIPHVTHHDDADITDFEQLATEIGELSEKARTKGLPMPGS